MRITGVSAILLIMSVIGRVDGLASASSPEAAFPVSVQNCGISTTYTQPPKRAFTMNQAATEMMLALGLRDRMVGTAFLDDAVLPEFAEAYKSIPVRAAAYPSRDDLLEARPDFVYAAYPSALSNEVSGMRDLLQSGADSYLSPSRCQSDDAKEPASMEAVFEEMRDIARIFGVLPHAEQIIAGYRSDLATIRDRIGAVTTRPRVFWWDSGMPPFVAGCCGAPNEILRLSGAQNIFPDLPGTWGTVQWDDVIARNPDVIVLVDAAWAPAAQKRQWLLANDVFAGIEAVKHQRFVTVSFSDATPGIRNVSAVRKVAEALYPDRFSKSLVSNLTTSKY